MRWKLPQLVVWLILPLLFVIALAMDVAAAVRAKLRRS